jgi:3',5'-cyclic AMP phosphodiesterase CpdA
MRTLLHISDLHFGRIDERLLAPLVDAAASIKPDLVIVSGDLTQRARSNQFRAAKTFLNLLPTPQLIVPGNHDVPMHNPIARFLYPLAGYRRHFSNDPEPSYQDKELAVLGLNSSRSLTIQDGRLNDQQIERLVTVFSSVPEDITKILVCHHPFSLPPGAENHRVVGGAARVLEAMAECRADAVLSGHLHTTHVACTALHEGDSGWAVLLSQAGTATSTRLRGQEASFNVLHVKSKFIECQAYVWNNERLCFRPASATNFSRVATGWMATCR